MAKKSTLVQNAQKYLQRGQIDRAIREYQRALKLDPSDLRVRHKLGELHARKGDVNDALKELNTVAQGYASDGFFLKAVAVYKQQLRLRRDLFEVHLHLGELYDRLNLYSEAMQHYTYVADYYERNGRLAECLQVYEKIVSLDKSDLATKLKLADLAIKLEEKDKAFALLVEINIELRERNRPEERLPVLERMVVLNPQDLPLQRELAEVYIAVSEPHKALGRLQICFKVEPGDPETLGLLASVFQGLDQPDKSKAVLKELVRIYNARGDEPRRQKTLTRVARIDPQDPDYLRWTSPGAVTEAPTAKAEALRPARELRDRFKVLYPDIRVEGRLAFLTSNGEGILEESERLMAQGELGAAAKVLKQGVLREPNSFRLHDRLSQLLLLLNDKAGASKVSLMLVKLAVGAREVKPAQEAVGYALSLATGDETVAMLANRLGVKEGVTPPLPEWSDGTPYLQGLNAHGAAHPAPEPPSVVVAVSEAFDDGLIDDSLAGDGLVDDGLIDDSLEDDAPEGELSALDLGDEDEHTGELTSIHLDADDESFTLHGMRAFDDTDVSLEESKTDPKVPSTFIGDDLVDDLVDDEDDDAFDFAQELRSEPATMGAPPQSGDGASQLQAQSEMAKAYLEMGLFDEAVKELSGLVLDGDAHYLMGKAKGELGDKVGARASLDAAIKSHSISPERRRDALFELGKVLESLGDDYRALENYRTLFSESRTYRPREVRGRIASVTARLASA